MNDDYKSIKNSLIIKDVEWLAGKLGNLKAVKKIDNYNHDDFLHNKNVKEVVYNDIFNLLPSP